MSRFIKLSTMIINTSRICRIDVHPEIYDIRMIQTQFSGFIMFGSGGISSQNSDIEICKKTNPIDYHIITKWIDKC
jgi:hypothetical protein